MRPAFSVICFTVLAGAGQGLVVSLAMVLWSGLSIAPVALTVTLGVALGMLLLGLVASFFHLGHPERAWRAMAMWRTSWLSREVIVLPVFMAVVFGWAVLVAAGGPVAAQKMLALLALALALVLWICTAQIYACLRFIQEWSHPLTMANFTLIGLASGALLASALAASLGEGEWLARMQPWAITLTFAAWVCRTASLLRNAALKPRSTAQSATGIRSARLVQKSMGMSAGAFNTREFFHGATEALVRHVRLAVHGLAFALPVSLTIVARGNDPRVDETLLWLAVAAQAAGLAAERWLFFAQARHPQNIYYQTVS